jgi:ribosomal protein S18 acetylase RimI-like enzyme
MLTALDPTVLRARAWDHGGRPLSPSGLARVALGGVVGIAANGLVFVAEEDSEPARSHAASAGMREAGTAPLMTLDLDCALAEAPARGVERVVDAAGMEELCELVRAAYAIDGSAGLRSDLPEVPGADAWLLREDGRAVAGLVATADPDLVAIWSMAVAPEHQRAGRGATLLRAVLGHHALEGVTVACLVATPAGEPLYRALGFRPIEQLAVWQPARP